MFCDVVVALPERDLRNKVHHRSTVGCHLGYDEKRRGHFVYCPKEQRLGTYKVIKWHEDRFTQCKGITFDTPVEYHTLDDLQYAPDTAALLPKFIRRPGGRVETISELSKNGWREEDEVVGQSMLENAYIQQEVSSETLLWVPGSTPGELSYAVNGTAAGDSDLPRTVDEARGSQYWPMVKDALESEIKGKFINNQAWDVVPRPKDRRVVKSKWVLKFFRNDDMSISKVKARLVACGYSQVRGQDYTEVFAATLSAANFRVFCCLIGLWDWETDQLDAVKAFTQPGVDAEIYVEMPDGFKVKGYVLKLKKALEGIKQGANLWFKLNMGVLTDLGFRASLTEPNLYKHESQPIMIAVFVDDIIAGYIIRTLWELT